MSVEEVGEEGGKSRIFKSFSIIICVKNFQIFFFSKYCRVPHKKYDEKKSQQMIIHNFSEKKSKRHKRLNN